MTAPIPRDIPDLPAIPGTPTLLPSYVPAAAVVPPVRHPLVAVYRLLVAAAATAGVALTLLLTGALHALSYFAVQSAILLALVSTLSARRAWTARRPLPSAVIGATLLYAVITALVYHLVLTGASPPFSMTAPPGSPATPTGWHAVANHLLHTVAPTAAVLDWLLLSAPGRLHLRQATGWMLYPLAYLVFALSRAEFLTPGTPGRYLYPFLDVDQHGYKSILANALLLGLFFYALALILVALDHTRPDPTRYRARRRIRARKHPRPRTRPRGRGKTGFRLRPPVG
ncbi:Pr6Pr family membrane protein [Streptomyces sp. MS06]|uniref:Pr6Pr family membrane protein n=1 Tax=Streptomyces sp. MS06 TaxID=3385974 RepID=UPI00399F4E64